MPAATRERGNQANYQIGLAWLNCLAWFRAYSQWLVEIVLHTFFRRSCLILTDIKPDNILANRGTGSTRFSDIKLSDLGDSAFEDASHNLDRSISGTAVYRAPEMILKAQLTTAVDIWAVGATVSHSRQISTLILIM